MPGRRSKLTPDVHAALVAAVRDGHFLAHAASRARDRTLDAVRLA